MREVFSQGKQQIPKEYSVYFKEFVAPHWGKRSAAGRQGIFCGCQNKKRMPKHPHTRSSSLKKKWNINLFAFRVR